MSLQPGTLLQGGKYQIVSQLGHGGFGVTYLAHHNLLDKQVCIKEFFPKDFMNRDDDRLTMCVNSASNISLMDALKHRFIKEARTISRFEHPNIISIYDVFEENATAYYVMEYIDGYSLQDMLKLHGAFSVEQTKRYMNKVLDAVEYIHNNSTLHLDIKPANIMVRRSDGRVSLIDFGLSKELDDKGHLLTTTSMVGITPRYAPLEQMQQSTDTPISTATDVYALGATLLAMVTGYNPPLISEVLEGRHIEMASGQPDEIKNTIVNSMAVTPAKRTHTAAEFRAMLNASNIAGGNGRTGSGNAGGGNAGAVSGSTNKATSAEKPKIKMWVWIAAMIAVVVISGGAYWYTNSFNSAIEEEMEIINEQCPLEATIVYIDKIEIKRNARSVVTIKSTIMDVYVNDTSRADLSALKRNITNYDESVDGVDFIADLDVVCGTNLLDTVFEEGWTIEYDYYDEDGTYIFTTEIGPELYEQWLNRNIVM